MRDRHRAALAAIVAGAAALRFATLDVQSLWYDEAVTASLVDGDLGHVLDGIPETESTPPLYYLLLWAWTRAFGTGEVGLRSLSALLGTAMVPVAYLAARELVSRRAGLVVALLAATNPFLVWYSQEARSYALVLLLGALSVLFFARTLRDSGGRPVAWWALASAAAIATHYYAAFLVVPEALWLLAATRDRRPALRGVAAGCGAVVLAGAALAPLAIAQADGRASAIADDSPLGERLLLAPKELIAGFDSPAELPVAAAMSLLVLAGVALVVLRGDAAERRGAATGALLGLAVVAGSALVALGGGDYVNTRNLSLAWLPAATAVGAGFGAGAAGRAGPLAAVALALLSTFAAIAVAAEPRYQRDDNRGAADALGPASADRVVVVTPADAYEPLRRYLPRAVSLSGPSGPVREYDLLAFSRRDGRGRALETPPRPPPPRVPGFRAVERRYTETFTLIRYRSARPRAFSRAGAGLTLDGRAPEVIFQRAAP